MPDNESPFSGAAVPAAEPAADVRGRGARGGKRGAGTADKRERILRAAIKVFARKGFFATRVSEIAKAAGVADGTIYLYFKNKDDVLVSLFDDRMRKLLAALRIEAAREDATEDKLSRIIELQLGLLEGHRDLAEVVTINMRQSTRLLKQYAAPLFNEYLEVIANVIAEGQRNGALREDIRPRVAARALWGALDGIALTWALGGAEPGGLIRAARELSTTLLDGMRKRSGVASGA